MNRIRKTCIIGLLIISANSMQAQFFKNLGTALKNAGKQIADTVVHNTRQGINNASLILVGGDPKNVTGGQTDSNATTSTSTSNVADNETDKIPDLVKKDRWDPVPTIDIDFEGFSLEYVSDVHDDIFYIKRPDGSYRFYSVKTARRIGTSDWRAGDAPRFDNGVCAVQSTVETPIDPAKPNGEKRRRWYILKSNGDSIALAPDIKYVTNFDHGVAIAQRTIVDNFYINDRGQHIYRDLKPQTAICYPLTNGCRRIYPGGKWGSKGYIDANGHIVIEPQYGTVRNFSSNYALVSDLSKTHGKWWLIDLNGKKVAEVPSHLSGVSDFIGGVAVAHNNESEKFDIINARMETIASYDHGIGFFLTEVPADAARAIVQNDGWKHPRFCGTTGKIYENAPPFEPYYEFEKENGEKHCLEPSGLSSYTNYPESPTFFLDHNTWYNTGYTSQTITLVASQGVLFGYNGVISTWDNDYTQVNEFCAEGYATGTKKVDIGQHQLKLTGSWVVDTETHYVIYDTNLKIMLEFIFPHED